MKRLLQVNVTANWGSTGKIAELIGQKAIEAAWESWIAYGRGKPQSRSKLIRIGNDLDMRLHGVQSRLLDNHGLASKQATKDFIEKVKEIKPDIIHLHNIHGYYLNYKILFDYLKEWGGPVVWTLHDCWPFTGHCAYYDYAKCDKWKIQCHDCPQLKSYPSSVWRDRSQLNYIDKKSSFLGMPDLTLVPVSDWLKGEVGNSFLNDYPAQTIHNGIDINVFRPKLVKKEEGQFVILGVASVWDQRKGLDQFLEIRKHLPDNYHIVLVGLNQQQISSLPQGITGIRRTDNVEQLVDLYNMADVYANPTLEDNFPTTNIEALASGTPVLTYNTGGSPEAIDCQTGAIVPYANPEAMAKSIVDVCEQKSINRLNCRDRAVRLFDSANVYPQYINLYNSLLK